MAQKQFIIDGGFVTNADSAITGNLEMTGHVLPSADITYDLGSPTAMWKDIYVGPGSLYINGKKVLEDDSDTITFTTDLDQDLRVSTSGVGSIELLVSGTGTIQAKGTLQMEDGKKITNSAGNAVQFGDKIDMDNNQIINVAAPTEAGHAANKTYVDTAVSNVDVTTELNALEASVTTDIATAKSEAISAAAADATSKANAAEADANSYTDARETAITTAYQTYADQAEADAISAAAADATSKANTAKAEAIAEVTNGAGAAFDTLKEIQDAMATDAELSSAISAITTVPNANQWSTARTVTLGGDLSGSVSIDGSSNVTLTATVADDSHNHTVANIDGLQATINDLTSRIAALETLLANVTQSGGNLRVDQPIVSTGDVTAFGA